MKALTFPPVPKMIIPVARVIPQAEGNIKLENKNLIADIILFFIP